MNSDRALPACGLATVLFACGPSAGDSASSSDDPSNTSGTASSGPGQTGGMDGTGIDSTDTGPPSFPSTCPEDADLNIAECPAQGMGCSHGDMICECVCNCGSPTPGQPGWYECDYARQDAWVLSDAAVIIDCDAGTIRSSLTATFDNTTGVAPVVIEIRHPVGYHMLPAKGGEQTTCGGVCIDEDQCPNIGPISVDLGEAEIVPLDFIPRECDRLAPAACGDFCGGTAEFTLSTSIEFDGIFSSLGPVQMTEVPIVCE